MKNKYIKPDTSKYKPPFEEIDGAYGFYGILTESEDGSYVQCHECGEWLSAITASHLKKHGLDNRGYKRKYMLSAKTPLASRKYRVELAKGYIKNAMIFSEIFKESKEKNRLIVIQNNKKRKGKKEDLECKNRKGTCRMQLIEKIREVAKEYKTEYPTRKMFYNYYKSKYINAVYAMFGTWTSAVNASGFVSLSESKRERYTNEKLLGYLQEFYSKYRRSPLSNDFDNMDELPNYKLYIKRFGNLNQARKLAGIPQIKSMGAYGHAEFI